MKLIVSELETGNLYQNMSPTSNQNIEAIRPHLYIQGNPAGSLKIQIQDNNGELIAESDYITIASITSAANFHGYVRFYINASLISGTTYRIKLASTGYTNVPGTFVGWCNDYDLKKYEYAYSPNTEVSKPLDMEIWTRSN